MFSIGIHVLQKLEDAQSSWSDCSTTTGERMRDFWTHDGFGPNASETRLTLGVVRPAFLRLSRASALLSARLVRFNRPSTELRRQQLAAAALRSCTVVPPHALLSSIAADCNLDPRLLGYHPTCLWSRLRADADDIGQYSESTFHVEKAFPTTMMSRLRNWPGWQQEGFRDSWRQESLRSMAFTCGNIIKCPLTCSDQHYDPFSRGTTGSYRARSVARSSVCIVSGYVFAVLRTMQLGTRLPTLLVPQPRTTLRMARPSAIDAQSGKFLVEPAWSRSRSRGRHWT